MFRPTPDVLKAHDLSDLVPEGDKLKAGYLIGNIDAAILQLVRSKRELRKYRDLYEGHRDPEEYAYLEENFGIGNPGRVKMIPIIRNRVQVLLGQHLQNPIKKQITCTDQQSIASLEQEKVEFAVKDVAQRLAAQLQSLLSAPQADPAAAPAAPGQPGQPAQPAPASSFGEAQLQELNQQLLSFQAGLEISAQHVLDELLQSPELRLKEKFTELLEHLLVESRPFYRVVPRQSGHMPQYDVIPAEELHFVLPPGERWLRNGTRFVRRQLLTRQQVLTRYGYLLSKDEREIIAGSREFPNLAWDTLPLGGERYLDYYGTGLTRPGTDAPQWNSSPAGRDQDSLGANQGDLVEVFHVEWLATSAIDLDEEDAPEGYSVSGEWDAADYDPVGSLIELDAAEQRRAQKNVTRYREDRFEGVRIGSGIYCAMGRTRNVVRAISDPWRASCSYRGYVHDFSLVGKTKDIQDSSDILHYQAENLVASSGVKGTTVDAALIPAWLDPDPARAIAKHRAHRKQGTNLVDSSQDANQDNKRGNSIGGDYDESLDGNSLRAIREQIGYLDEVAGNITGVNRQMLGAITDQDLVGNTDAARVQSTLITKPLFQIIDTLVQDSLTDLLNACRSSYQTGRKAVTTLGEAGQQVFTLHPHFGLADYLVFVADGQEEIKQLEQFRSLGKEFIAAGLMQPEDLIDLLTSTSLTRTKQDLKKSSSDARAKQTQQLQQQVEQLTQQLQQAQSQLQAVDQNKMQAMQAELGFRQQELQLETTRVANEKEKGDKELDIKEASLELERDQIAFSNQALEVKNAA